MALMRFRFIRDDRLYIYADISVETQFKKIELCPRKLKMILLSAMKDAFGDYGLSIQIDLLKFREKDNRAYIRFPAKEIIRVQSALTLIHSWENQRIHIVIHKLSHCISALSLESFNQQHQIVETF